MRSGMAAAGAAFVSAASFAHSAFELTLVAPALGEPDGLGAWPPHLWPALAWALVAAGFFLGRRTGRLLVVAGLLLQLLMVLPLVTGLLLTPGSITGDSADAILSPWRPVCSYGAVFGGALLLAVLAGLTIAAPVAPRGSLVYRAWGPAWAALLLPALLRVAALAMDIAATRGLGTVGDSSIPWWLVSAVHVILSLIILGGLLLLALAARAPLAVRINGAWVRWTAFHH